jgi:iron complex outermembrane receptor protein
MTTFQGALRVTAVASVPGCAVALVLATATPACAQPGPGQHAATQLASADLDQLTLEQLRDVIVTTVSRGEERLDRTAAAAYVITGEDIRRSGATTIMEALRLAPMLEVARADANQYAISARGFDNVLANKMLVLIDGRTVYTPLFSGVLWEAQDVMLEDVDRIEVITGPSTALWGSNAVNGLIHIITRAAGQTQGPAAALSAGNAQRGAAVRFGGSAGAERSFRLYAKSYDRSDTHLTSGASVNDAAEGVQAGFRADWSSVGQKITLQGDTYRGAIEQSALARRFYGTNLLGRWERSFDDGADANVQAYVEQTRRDQPLSIRETLDTFDLVGQYGLLLAGAHRVLVGAGLRHSNDDVTPSAAVGFVPPSRGLTWKRVFAQDRIALAPALALTLASSVETDPYHHTEVLPSLRLAWQADADSLWWSSLSRAVRAPARVDRELVQPSQPPYVFNGGPDFRAEVSNVLEIGHRAQPSPTLSYSVTLYRHQHRRLRSVAPTPAGLQFQNGIEGSSEGAETWLRWQPTERWRLDAGANWLRQKLHVSDGAVDVGGLQSLGNDPRQWASLRSSLDLTARIGWDLAVRHVGRLRQPVVPAYTAVDSRIAWKVASGTELALLAQNLFDPGHAEWGPAANRVEFGRTLLVQVRWRL